MDKFYLKKAKEDDLLLLYEWANDKDVRNNSFSTSPVSLGTHKEWFYKKLNSVCCDIFIYYMNEIPIGQIRLEYRGNCAQISYSIDKNYRGQGHGENILMLTQQKVLEERKDIDYFEAEVKSDNIPSNKVFQNLGYEGTSFIKYTKNLKAPKSVVSRQNGD